MIVLTIAFVSCFSWLRSGMERYADRKLSLCCQFFVSGFVGLLTYPFMRRGFSPLHKRIASAFSRSHDSPSNDRFSPHAGCVLHGKQHFRNTATFGSLPRCLLTAEPASFRVRDSHPIPLFSEQECVSDCSGRALATKAMVCNFRYNCSRFLRIKLRKARFLRETLHKEFPLFSPKTGTTPFTVGFCNSAFADARLHCKPLHLTYQRFCCLALLRQNRVRSIKKPLLFS